VTTTLIPATAPVEVKEAYQDAYDFVDYSLDDPEPEDNDEYLYGGYGTHFDSYSTFDADDYEYQQSLYY
jgi:hypothetical protein